MNRKQIGTALAIFSLALLARLLFLAHLHPHPYFENLMIDSASYDRWAGRIVGGDFWGKNVFYQSPLYPYFLGMVYSIFGRDLLAARLVQAVVGSTTCVFLFLLTSRLFSRKTGIVAGVLAALYTTFIFQDSMLLKSVIVFFFLSLSLLALSRETGRAGGRAIAIAGLLFGVAICGRGNLLFAAPLIALWLLLREKPLGRRAAWKGALFLLAAAVAVAPVTLRNRIVGGDWVMTESDAGINVYVGNNPKATGIHTPPFNIRTVPEHEEIDAARLAERESGRSLKPSEVSRYWIDRAGRFVLSEPGSWLRLVGRKFRLAWNGYEIPDNYDQAYFGKISWIFRGFLPSFLWVSPFALLGMAVSLRNWRRVGFLHLYVVAYLVSLLALYVTSRYRLPMAIGLIPFAAHGAVWFAGRLRERSWAPVFFSLLLLAAVFLFGRASLFDYYGFAKQETEIATFHTNRGNYEEAERAFERAVIEGKGSGALHLVYMNQGLFFVKTGRPDRAAESFRNALRANPSFTPARLQLEALSAAGAEPSVSPDGGPR